MKRLIYFLITGLFLIVFFASCERDNFDAANPSGQQTSKLLEMADFVVINDANLEEAMKEIENIWRKIENKA